MPDRSWCEPHAAQTTTNRRGTHCQLRLTGPLPGSIPCALLNNPQASASSWRPKSLCQVINQTVRIFDVTSWGIRLIFSNLATLFLETRLGFLDAFDSHFENRSKRRASLNKKVDVLSAEADHIWLLIRNRKAKFLDIEGSGLHGVSSLNQTIRAKCFCHKPPSQPDERNVSHAGCIGRAELPQAAMISVSTAIVVTPTERLMNESRLFAARYGRTWPVVRRSCDAGLHADPPTRVSRARADGMTGRTDKKSRSKRRIARNGVSTALFRSRNSEPRPRGRKLHPAHPPDSAPRVLRSSSSRPQAGDYSTWASRRLARPGTLQTCRPD